MEFFRDKAADQFERRLGLATTLGIKGQPSDTHLGHDRQS
jgi:hypothetical protein